jgi:hypothetical protein
MSSLKGPWSVKPEMSWCDLEERGGLKDADEEPAVVVVADGDSCATSGRASGRIGYN